MIDVPYEDAVKKIKEASNLADDEIESRVNEKLEQLSGLISKDGAIHIVANELGVQLAEPAPEGELKIADITLNSRNIKVTGKVVKKYEVREFNKNDRQGKVASLLLGDETGVTRLVFWNDQVEVFEELKEDDVLVVQNPFVKQSYMKDRTEIHLNDQSSLTVNPEGVTVEVKQREEEPRVQKYIKNLEGGEQNVELVATIVQVFEPRFYDACPECRKKVENNLCPTHGEVKSEVNYNLSTFLDDGTGNVRVSFWKNQSLQLTGKSDEEFVKYRDAPESFEDVKTELLGEIVKVVGNVKKNEQFDRLEFTAQLVFTDVDPAQEIQNLEKKLEEDRQQELEPEKKPGVKEETISLEDLEEAN